MITLLHLICFLVVNILTALLGYVLFKQRLLTISWLFMIAVLVIIYFIFRHEHPALLMLAIVAVTFTAMKPIPAITDYREKAINLNLKQWLTFALAWAGMRLQPFENLDKTLSLINASQNIRFGLSRLLAGALLIALAILLTHTITITNTTYSLISCTLLIGLSLALHFGLLSISTGMLRRRGVNVGLLFKSPLKANSLSEFWGKRWNLAFSEMTSIAVFRPLKKHIGAGLALLASFTFSGLLHEVALSLPVNSGYGLPTLYFLLHGILVLAEKRWLQHSIILQNPLLAKVWTFCWIILPAPLLFHHQFIMQVIWPLTANPMR